MENDYFDEPEFKELLERYNASVNSGKPLYIASDEATDLIGYFDSIGEKDVALGIANYSQALHPGEFGPLTFLARNALEENNPAEATRFLEKMTPKKGFHYNYLKAEILLFNNKMAQAYKLMRKELAEEIKVDDITEAEKDDFRLDVAELFLDYRLPTFARYWLDDCSDKQSEDYMEVSIRSYIELGEYEFALEDINELIDRNPYKYSYWNLQASVYVRVKMFNEALECLGYSMAIAPNNRQALIYMVKTYLVMGKSSIAIDVAKRYLNEYIEEKNSVSQVMELFLDNRHPALTKKLFLTHIEPVEAKKPEGELRRGYTLMAMACYDCGYKKLFGKYLSLAIRYNPAEVRHYFFMFLPKDSKPEEYESIIMEHAKNL